MKVRNLAKMLVAAGLVAVVTGCVSMSGEVKKMANNQSEGVVYGFSGAANEGDVNKKAVKDMCDAIGDKDYHCKEQENYISAVVFTKIGFAEGVSGIRMLVEKDFPGLDKLRHNMVTGDKKAPYVKARVVPGQLGELLEIVSTDGDGKCYWSGMPRTGGTVCPAYNYDYRKDYTGDVVYH